MGGPPTSRTRRDRHGESRLEHLNSVLRAIRNVNQLITRDISREELLRGTCECLTETRGFHSAWAALLNETGQAVSLSASSGLDGGFDETRRRLERGDFPVCVHRALRQDGPVVIKDPQTECAKCALGDEYGARAALVSRLASQSRVYGVLAVSVPVDFARDDEEQGLFEEVAGDVAFALRRIEDAEALRESQRRYREIFEGSRDGYVMVDACGRITDANHAFCRMLGYTLPELREMDSFYEITPERWRAWETEEIWEKRLLVDGYSGVYEKEYIRKDGRVIPVELQSYAVFGAGGEPEYLWGVARDISAEKQAGETLRRKQLMLERTEHVANIGSWEWDVTTDTVTWSDELFRIFGLDPAQGTPTFAEHHRLYPPEDLERLQAAVHRAIHEGASYALELTARRADGALRRCVSRGYPEAIIDGKATRLFGSFQDITERKQAEEALAESEQRFRMLFEEAPVGVFRTTSGGQALIVNPAMARILGYESADEVLAHYTDLASQLYVHAHDRDEFVRRLRADGRVEGFEYEARRVDGRVIWLGMNARIAETREDGSFIIDGFAVDITERKRAESAIQESEHRFRSFVENAGDIVYALTPDGVFTYISPNWLEFMGEPAEAATGRLFEPYVHPDDQHLCREFLERVLRTEEGHDSVEYRVRRADGSESWHTSRGSPLRDEAGRVVGYVGIARDMTEQKRAAEQLRASEVRFRELFQNMTSGVAVYDPVDDATDFVFKDLNAAGERIVKIADKDVVGRRVTEVFPKVSDLGVLDALRRVWRTGTPEFLPISRYEDNRVALWVENKIYKLPTGEVVAVFDDRTDQRKLEEQLLQSQKMEAVGRLAGGVAHDFNNVLTAILGNVELARLELEDDPADPPDLHVELDQIEQAAQRAARLTRQLLAFSRREVTQPQMLDLNRTISDLEKMLRRLLAEDIVFEFRPAEEAVPVRMDPGQLEQVIMNLVVNAGDAMPQGGRLTIETSSVDVDDAFVRLHAGTRPGTHAVISISDTGCGMDEQTKRRIWEPFFTTKGVGQGTGLGLATVYGIVKQADGTVTVYSEPGRGTTFKVYLPCWRGDDVLSHESQDPAAELRGTETVMVCEDDQAVRELTTQMLRSAGYDVLAARSGKQALDKIVQRKHPVALLITDVVMPDMNGRELVEALGQRAARPPLVLYVSGYTSNVIAHHGVVDQDVEFLEKPFSRNALLRRVRALLDSGH